MANERREFTSHLFAQLLGFTGFRVVYNNAEFMLLIKAIYRSEFLEIAWKFQAFMSNFPLFLCELMLQPSEEDRIVLIKSFAARCWAAENIDLRVVS